MLSRGLRAGRLELEIALATATENGERASPKVVVGLVSPGCVDMPGADAIIPRMGVG